MGIIASPPDLAAQEAGSPTGRSAHSPFRGSSPRGGTGSEGRSEGTALPHPTNLEGAPGLNEDRDGAATAREFEQPVTSRRILGHTELDELAAAPLDFLARGGAVRAAGQGIELGRAGDRLLIRREVVHPVADLGFGLL